MADRNHSILEEPSNHLTRRGLFTFAAAILSVGAVAGLAAQTAVAQESPERHDGHPEDRKDAMPKPRGNDNMHDAQMEDRKNELSRPMGNEPSRHERHVDRHRHRHERRQEHHHHHRDER